MEAAVAIRPKPRPHRAKDGPIRHTDEEWNAVYPHIRRMYVLEGQKLRYVIDKLAREHAFIVNPQTLRKRFVQWGIHKQAGPRKVQAVATRKSPQAVSLVSRPTLSRADVADLSFLSSIQSWTLSFLDQLGSRDDPTGVLVPPPRSSTYNAEKLSFSFRLVTSLLRQGEGTLAGLLARKAFSQVEDILNVEGPLFVWNFFEILWYMLSNGQRQLALMLLAHLVNLAQGTYHAQHPIQRVLDSLQKLLSGDESHQGLSPVLEKIQNGWSLNAELLFSPPDARLVLLYYRIVWDSGLIKISEHRLRQADMLYDAIKEKQPTKASTAVEQDEVTRWLSHSNPNDYPTAYGLQDSTVVELPAQLDSLVYQSMKQIRDLSAQEPIGTMHRFRALSGLIKTTIWENESPTFHVGIDCEDAALPRLNARVLSFVMRIIFEADSRKGADSEAAIGNLGNIIALREHGQGPVDPQVIYEQRELEYLLLRAGRVSEAHHVHEVHMQRLREYVDDVPTYIDT